MAGPIRKRTLLFWLRPQLECSARFCQYSGIFFHLNIHFPSYMEEHSWLVERPMRFLPVFLDLASGTVALVGSGAAALNKLRLLRAAGANVRWYSSSADVAEEVLLASL